MLPTIVFAQFACTSLWFAGGAVRSLGGTSAVFGNLPFQQAALEYFGHMWELYTFWAFVPLLLAIHAKLHSEMDAYGPSWVFGLIAAGAPACVAGRYLAQRVGGLRTARVALAVSGACCLLSRCSGRLSWWTCLV